MKVSEDLTALIFELQRSRSPVDRARALARAWRTVRTLSPADRRLLVREVGFDGAEDLIEGLAGKSGGAFAPAAVLEALGAMRKDESLSVRSVLSRLVDRERREEMLLKGIDLAADVVEGESDDASPEGLTDDFVVANQPDAEPSPRRVARPPVATDVIENGPAAAREKEVKAGSSRLPPVPQTATPEPGSASAPGPDTILPEPSVWDPEWGPHAGAEEFQPPRSTWREIQTERGRTQQVEGTVEGTLLDRLRAARTAIPTLRTAGLDEIEGILETLPEPWARRRAMMALIDAGVPDDAGEALDLIAELERPADRGWCLSALARRGDLGGENLDRALRLLPSPAARRRVEAMANRGR